MSELFYVPLCTLDNTTIYLFVILLYNSVVVSNNNCSVDLQNTIAFFISNFTQIWLNSYHSSSALPFIVEHKQSNKYFWSRRRFVLSFSRELYCDFIVVFTCAFEYLSIPFLLILIVIGLLGTCSSVSECLCVMC